MRALGIAESTSRRPVHTLSPNLQLQLTWGATPGKVLIGLSVTVGLGEGVYIETASGCPKGKQDTTGQRPTGPQGTFVVQLVQGCFWQEIQSISKAYACK